MLAYFGMRNEPNRVETAFIQEVKTAFDERQAQAVGDPEVVGRISQRWLAEQMNELGHSWHQTTVAKTLSGERRLLLSEAVALAEIFRLGLPGVLNSVRVEHAEQIHAHAVALRRLLIRL